jgi:hypothetical protein
VAHADAVLIMGSSMAEQHRVRFRVVIQARERGEAVLHVDPRFTRTSAMADIWAPIHAGSGTRRFPPDAARLDSGRSRFRGAGQDGCGPKQSVI